MKRLILLAALLCSAGALVLASVGTTVAAGATCPPGTTDSSYCTTPKQPGVYCAQAGESKKKLKGQKGGTPYALCVKALAQIKKAPKTAPAKACAKLTPSKIKGQKNTPRGACVSAGKKYKTDLGT